MTHLSTVYPLAELTAPPAWYTVDFISDLHLNAGEPATFAAWQHYLQTTPADAVFMLGDLFEVWVGDDVLEATPNGASFEQRCAQTLHQAADRLALFFMHGNRDFLVGPGLMARSRATLLADPTLIELYGLPTLLCHGDTLCTDDTEYMQHRSRVHEAPFQQQFLARPLAARKAYIAQLRALSIAEKQVKDRAIMDVNPAAVEALLRSYGYPRLIHGHTHRPNHHQHTVDGRLCERWVLGDWHRLGQALRCDPTGCRAFSV